MFGTKFWVKVQRIIILVVKHDGVSIMPWGEFILAETRAIIMLQVIMHRFKYESIFGTIPAGKSLFSICGIHCPMLALTAFLMSHNAHEIKELLLDNNLHPVWQAVENWSFNWRGQIWKMRGRVSDTQHCIMAWHYGNAIEVVKLSLD